MLVILTWLSDTVEPMCLLLGKYGTEQKLRMLPETTSDIVTISLERVVAECLWGQTLDSR